jgi:hypothetical protein
MTETTSTSEPNPQGTLGEDIPLHPSDIMLNVIVAFLAPMFLSAAGGNLNLARMAAIETVNAYRAQTQSDLLAVAQIVAFGLTALGSLSLSMADNLSLSMTLRLRTAANALHRSAEQNRRALHRGRPAAPTPDRTPSPAELTADADNEATVIAGVAKAQRSAAETRARLRQADQAASAPAAAGTTTTPAMTAEQRHQAMWAGAIADVAGEYAASLPNLPPLERKAATLRAAALSSSAHALLTGTGLPPLPVPFRLDPANPKRPA